VATDRYKLLFLHRPFMVAGQRQIPNRDFPAVLAAGFFIMVLVLQQFFLQFLRNRAVAFAFIPFAARACCARRKGNRNH
jgi:hypothetical protein